MEKISEINELLETCRVEPVWFIRVELAERDDERVRAAVAEAVGLHYGSYSGVAYEGASGLQFFQPEESSKLGNDSEAITMPVRVLTFSIEQDAELLARAIEAIRHTHSYEEPVIYITGVLATRANYATGRDNPNRWWNRGFDK